MNTQQIKVNLINAINNINNPALLMKMSKIVEINSEDRKIIKLKQDQIDELKIAIAQIENGEFLSHEDAKKQSEEWLKD